ncbi:MAG: hypothetical protein AAFX00_02985 [Pseudomonadota bacterium]
MRETLFFIVLACGFVGALDANPLDTAQFTLPVGEVLFSIVAGLS